MTWFLEVVFKGYKNIYSLLCIDMLAISSFLVTHSIRRWAFSTDSVRSWSILKCECSLFFLTFPKLNSIEAKQIFRSIQISAWIFHIIKWQNGKQDKNCTNMKFPDVHFYLLWALTVNGQNKRANKQGKKPHTHKSNIPSRTHLQIRLHLPLAWAALHSHHRFR